MTITPPPAPEWNAQPAGPAVSGYGGFWLRVVAYVIDAIVLDIALWIVGAILGTSMWPSHFDDPGAAMQWMTPFSLASLVGAWLYFALMESSARGATLGKRAVGLRVVTEQGDRLSFLNATGRFFSKFVSAAIFCIGFIMVAFTNRKRGLHDMMAGTLVVKIR